MLARKAPENSEVNGRLTNDGGPWRDAHIDRFTDLNVALVYVEPEVTAPREIIQPF